RAYGIDPAVPLGELDEEARRVLLYGADREVSFDYQNSRGRVRTFTAPFEGVVAHLERRYRESQSDWARSEVEQFMSSRPCLECKGKRLRPETLAVTVGGLNIMEVSALSVRDARDFFAGLVLS